MESILMTWEQTRVTQADIDVARERMRAAFAEAHNAARDAGGERPWRSTLHYWEARGPVDFLHTQARGALAYLKSLERAFSLGL